MISDKFKIILICTFYNLLLEFWVWGIPGFITIILPISVFLMYLSYFSILEDLIVRFKLRDLDVLLIGFFYGIFQESFNTGSTFNNPNFFGLNIFNIIMADILWWGILQSIFALYFANKIVKKNQEEFEKMGILGWILAVGFNVLLFMGAFFGNKLPNAPLYNYIIILLTWLSIFIIIIIRIKKNQKKTLLKIEQIGFVDTLIKIQIFLCLIIGGFLVFIIGILTLYLFIIWSFITGIVYFSYIVKNKRFIGNLLV
ncbi:MAG: hypothetical protein ACTSQP_16295 [Promethearchaeota archaeon]